MKLFFVFLATSALGHAAMAQTPECKTIGDPSARLACYDRATPPAASPTTARPIARAAPASKADSTKYVDSISAEDAVMNERMKGICRGC